MPQSTERRVKSLSIPSMSVLENSMDDYESELYCFTSGICSSRKVQAMVARALARKASLG